MIALHSSGGRDMRQYNAREHSFHGANRAEDNALWNLIQRVCRREEDKERRLQAASQLSEYIGKPESKAILSRTLEQILNSLIDVFFERSGVSLQKDVANIIACIGHTLSDDPSSFFRWTLLQFQTIANDNVRNYLLQSVHKLLSLDMEERKYSKVVGMLMDELQVTLESIDVPEHLPTCIDPLMIIAQNYPQVFSKHFRDTVDILVGWHIDHTQKMSLTLFASESLVKLHTHWLTDLHFSLNLLSQFIEDMEAYAEDFHKIQAGETADSSCLSKMAALMRVFSTVVRSIGPVFHANNGPPVTESFVLDTLHRVIVCAQMAGDGSLAVTRAADECARLLLGAVQWKSEEMVSESLLTYAVHAVERSRSDKRLLIVLDFITVMVQELGSALPAWFIQGLLGPSSRLLPLKHSRCPELCTELLALYQACLAVKSVPLLQTAYKHVVGELQQAINGLLTLHANKGSAKLDIIADNPFDSSTAAKDGEAIDVEFESLIDSRKEAIFLKTATFDIVALLEVADAKNSLIGMYALSPSIFDFLHSGLKVVHKHLSQLFPSLQYSILQTLHSHCQRHKNFISSFLGGAVSSESVGFIDNVTTATHLHFPSILEFVADFLVQISTSADTRMLLLQWVKEIMERLKMSKDAALTSVPAYLDVIHSLSIIATQPSQALATLSADCLLMCLESVSSSKTTSSGLVSSVYKLAFECCLVQIGNINKTVEKKFSHLLLSIPLDRVLSMNHEPYHENGVKKIGGSGKGNLNLLKSHTKFQTWQCRRMIVNKSALTDANFDAHHFKDFMEKLLRPGTMHSDWFNKFFWSCQRQRIERGNHPRNSQLSSSSTQERTLLVWWGIWKAAEFTVLNKLKTPLGRSEDTLKKIEGAIRDYERKLTSSHLPTPSHKLKEFILPSHSALERPRLILQFVDNLEKLLYCAYEGCAVATPPFSTAVRSFFSTNRQTCEQWLNRLRLALMRIALQCGVPAFAFQHGQAILNDMRKRKNTTGVEFESAVTMTAESLISLKSPQAVDGLYRWCRELGGSKHQWLWLKAAKLNAAENYKDAIKDYNQALVSTSKKHSEHSGDAPTVELNRKTVSPVRNLIVRQLVSSYGELGSWDDLQSWLNTESKNDSSLNKELSCLNLDYIKALNSFEKSDVGPALEKSQSFVNGYMEKPLNSALNGVLANGKCWGWGDLGRVCEAFCITAQLKASEKESFANSLKLVENACSSCVKLSTASWPSIIQPNFYSIYAIAASLNKDTLPITLSGKIEQSNWLNGSPANQILNFLQNSNNESDKKLNKSASNLALAMMKSHRKHSNFKKAKYLLTNEINLLSKEATSFSVTEDLLSICNLIPESANSLDLRYESSKLLHATGQQNDAMGFLVDLVSSCIEKGVKADKEKCSRALLTLVNFLQSDWKNISLSLKGLTSTDIDDDENLLVRKLKILLELEKGSPNCFSTNTQLISEVNQEIVVGSLLNLATIQAPDLAKSWFLLGGWCYKWGRKIIDATSSAGSVELTDDEKDKVKTVLLPLGVSSEQLDEVYKVLRKAHYSTTLIPVEEENFGDISVNIGNRVDGNEAILEQLKSDCGSWLRHMPQTVAQGLGVVWQQVCSRLFSQYSLAAHSYFKFLHLNSNEQVLKHEDSNVTATLRLLRLLVKHALELQSTLKTGLANTPTTPWKGITPQLFSRLNHPEPYVCRSISDLLCRVAARSPHLIAYPVVVATSKSVERGEEEGVGGGGRSESNDATKTCYDQVLQALTEQNASSVRDVQLLVLELRRITLLWEELWLGALRDLKVDTVRRLQQLHDEAKRVNGNVTLTKNEKQAILREQQQAIMRPIFYSLRRVNRLTNVAPETPHEKWFAEMVQPLIENALVQLKSPPNPHNPNSCWAGFKQVHNFLQQRASKRSAHILNLADISPRLMALSSTSVSIPGVTNDFNPVTIEACSSALTILPTKTKPKKLQFIGSDGKRYTYLFKGREDLHLDERIMQFLSTTNRLLHRQHGNQGYLARNYSVTPLGPRSGLIQWVSGATPLFLLYKRWQQRKVMAQFNKQGGENANLTTMQILGPSDIYYNKLNPALKQAGLEPEKANRKDWPMEVVRSVLGDLLADTPNDLLQKELWCSSTSANEYWHIQQKHSQSTAVMSMIGYVIGLGDRHLDNILIDLETGEVVHIDYNVCFEKGLQLRVPEKVPFRLTQNILQALGFSGVEGVFRNSCEQVLSTLRKGRETLLTLLEAFVYDPLVDWTGTAEGGIAGAAYGGGPQQGSDGSEDKLTKKDMEREITRSLFSSRVAEMKQGWFNNRDEMMKILPDLVKKLNNYKNHFKTNIKLNNNIQDLLEIKSQVKSALLDSQHSYNFLPQRWSQDRQQQVKKEDILNIVQDKAMLLSDHMKRNKILLQTLQSPELAALLAEATANLNMGPCAFEHAAKFLNSAGQATMVSQAQVTEKELVAVTEQRRLAVRSCLDVLSQYAAVAAHFPPQAALRQHQNAVCRGRLEKVAEGLLNNDCSVVREDVVKSKSKDAILSQTRAVAVKDSALQRETNDLKNELLKLVEQRNRESVVSSIKDAEMLVNQSNDDIFKYVQEHGLDGIGAISSVLATILCSLDQKAITMETTAAQAGHRLVDMTSQEGDWFLEELCGLFGNVVKLLHIGDNLIKLASSNSDKASMMARDSVQAVRSADRLFKTLNELFVNFRNIIVPEAVKLLQSEEPSVVELVGAVAGILQPVRLDDLIKQLMGCLRSQGMVNGSPTQQNHNNVLTQVQDLQAQYNQLLQDSRQKRSDELRLTAGQLLLQAFDGLFRSVLTDFNSLLYGRGQLSSQTPTDWNYIDALHTPLQLHKFKNLEGSSEYLKALLFLKQLQSMHDFFALCQSNAKAFVINRLGSPKKSVQGLHYSASKCLYTEDRLSKPIKHFISHFVQELLIGIPSEVLGYSICSYIELLGFDIKKYTASNTTIYHANEICKSAVEAKYSQNYLAKASMLVYHFNQSWKGYDRIKRLDANILAVRSSLHRSQLQVTRFQWLHEDLYDQSNSGNFVVPRRGDVLADLSKRMTSLHHLDCMLQQVQEKASTQHTSIKQRLKWAAGANPSLQGVLRSVEEDSQARSVLLKSEDALSLKVLEVCESALAYEQSRLPNRDAANLEFNKLLENAESICRVIASSPVQIDDQERAAVEVLPPRPGIKTNEWLKLLSEKLHQNIGKHKHQRHEEEAKMLLVKTSLREIVGSVEHLLLEHGRLLSDVKALLKTMAKEEGSSEADSEGVKSYMERYKEMTSSLWDALKDVKHGCDVGTMLDPDPLIERITQLGGMIGGIYEDLVSFASPYLDPALPTFASALKTGSSILPLGGARRSPGLKRQTELAGSQGVTPNTPPLGGVESAKSLAAASPRKMIRDPRTGKAVQERNHHGMNVWRRVKAKLDGKDGEGGKRLLVPEQVEFVINEASSFDNLALLYEGWTSWV